MRLHRLEITAFGPFADTSTVDFDELGGDGLFLLHGQTGAGKTTVLDAIAFALYGTVPGARQECKRLHSDHAAVGAVPRVVLEATIGGRRLRVTRSPEYQRPKLRGNGMRTENAKATLTWLDGRGQNLTRINEIGDEVNRLLGMSADQFFQVVLLPQGEFARFLRADNESREKLLERLFDTERFASAEQWLSVRRRESAARFQDQQLAIDRLISRVSTAADAQVPPAEPLDWAQDLLDSARTDKDSLQLELATAKAAATQAGERLADERRVVDLQRRAEVAQQQLAEHADDSDRLKCLADELESARRAGPAVAAIRDAEAAGAVAEAATSALREASSSLATVEGSEELLARLSWPAGAQDRSAIDDAIREWTAEVGRLDSALADTRTAELLADELTALADERVHLTARAAELTDERSRLPERMRLAEAELEKSIKGAATIAGLEKEREVAAVAVAAAVELVTRRKELAVAAERLRDCRDAFSSAREHTLDIREQRLAGMAAELAADLKDGAACQVCGATEHPAPATANASSKIATDTGGAGLVLKALPPVGRANAAGRFSTGDCYDGLPRKLLA